MRKPIILLTVICLIFALAACSVPAEQTEPGDTFTPFPTPSPTPGPTPTPEPTPSPTPEPFGLPNVYLFILDEYSSFDILSKYYGYDNKVMDDYFDMEGFNLSRESYSTDNQTEHSICDLLNLEYISRDYSKKECHNAISKAELYNIFSDLGYSQFQYSTDTDYFEDIPSLTSKSGRKAYEEITAAGEEFTGIAPDSSISDALSGLLFPEDDTKADVPALNQWGVYTSEYIRDTKAYKKYEERRNASRMLNVFDYFEDPNNYAPTTPRVIYSYIQGTHVPFVFNEFGGIIPFDDSRNWKDEDVYLGQYKFLTKHMIATFSTIIANDPDSVIIFMCDHGIRYHADCKLKHKFVISDKDSLRIMNAVYIKGQELDIEGLSAINTLRCILSLYEGHEQDYPPIEDPVTSESPDCLKGIIPKSRHK